ncbi:hypothetical protein ACIOK4_42970 [Streptomyces bottropensis]|uniref:hypothetical protein n=1 Tax=Streptomyces bottropensis TaxID=42235 RepID=UPI003787C9DA
MKTRRPAEGSQEAVYQVRLPLSKRTIDLVAGLIRKRRKELGSRWRKLAPGAQAVVMLAVLRHDQRLADMAGGNGVAASTVRRWVKEAIEPAGRRAGGAAGLGGAAGPVRGRAGYGRRAAELKWITWSLLPVGLVLIAVTAGQTAGPFGLPRPSS